MESSRISAAIPEILQASETASQFFVRKKRRPCRTGVLPVDFLDVHDGDIVEFYGPSGSGKTAFLIQVVVSCILPQEWRDIDIGGRESRAIFIDTEYKLDIFRIAIALAQRVEDAIRLARGEDVDEAEVEDAVNELRTTSLRRLHVFRCGTSFELLCTIRQLKDVAANESQCPIKVLAIDSISGFFWQDKSGVEAEFYSRMINAISKSIQTLAKTMHLAAFATRSLYFWGSNKVKQPLIGKGGAVAGLSAVADSLVRDYINRVWLDVVKHRVLLCRSHLSIRHISPAQCVPTPIFVAGVHKSNMVVEFSGLMSEI